MLTSVPKRITLLGVLLQNIGFACIAPLWMFLHLTLSPTVVNPKPFQLACSRPIQLALAPFAVARKSLIQSGPILFSAGFRLLARF